MVLKKYLKFIPHGNLLSLALQKGTEWVAIGYPYSLDFTAIDSELEKRRKEAIGYLRKKRNKDKLMYEDIIHKKFENKNISIEDVLKGICLQNSRRNHYEECVNAFVRYYMPKRIMDRIRFFNKRIKELTEDPFINVSVLDREVTETFSYFYPIDGRNYTCVKVTGTGDGSYWDYDEVARDGFRFIKRRGRYSA